MSTLSTKSAVQESQLVAVARTMMLRLHDVYPVLLEREKELERRLQSDEESTEALADLTEARSLVLEEILSTLRPMAADSAEELEELE